MNVTNIDAEIAPSVAPSANGLTVHMDYKSWKSLQQSYLGIFFS